MYKRQAIGPAYRAPYNTIKCVTSSLLPNMNTGSNIIFKISHTNKQVIEYFGEPYALMIEESVVYIIINGAPIKIIFPYVIA